MNKRNVIDFTAARRRIDALSVEHNTPFVLIPIRRPTLVEQLRIRLTQEELAELVTVTLEESK